MTNIQYLAGVDEAKSKETLYVTGDLALFKKEWKECELGELKDDDLRVYLGCPGRVVDKESDDDTLQLEWINMDTQWIPVKACTRNLPEDQKRDCPVAYIPSMNKLEGALDYLTIETVKKGETVFVTHDLKPFKKEWKECELGALKDEDLEIYLGCPGKVVEVESDDDTVQLQWINMDTQWIPVKACTRNLPDNLKRDCPVAYIPSMNKAEGGLEYLTLGEVKKGETVFVTHDLKPFKKEWKESECGDLKDEDLEIYLGCPGKIMEIESDDDTVQLQWINMDTMWIPIKACTRDLPKDLQRDCPVAYIPSMNKAEGGLEYLNIREVKKGETVFVTHDLKPFKKEWKASELGELKDDDLKIYLGCPGKVVEIESDDDTVQLQWINMDTQWIPVNACTRDLPKDLRRDVPATYIPSMNSHDTME